MKMPPAKAKLPPPDGWEERTYYIVEASFSVGNPIHQYIFFTGFLQDGKPGGYNQFCSGSSDTFYSYGHAYYLKPIHKLAADDYVGVVTLDGEYKL